MTREEAQRLREEEMAAQAQGKDCFIIPQANLDRFLPDGVTVSRESSERGVTIDNPFEGSVSLHLLRGSDVTSIIHVTFDASRIYTVYKFPSDQLLP